MPDLNHELHPALVATLACPVCGAPLHISDQGGSLLCEGEGRVHCFDGGGAGYVPLAPRHSGGGDNKEAVRARSAFLRHGYYAPAAKGLVEAVQTYTPAGGLVLDAGCGEGYYSDQVAASGHPVLGVDLSKFAVDAAARAARTRRREADLAPDTLYAVGSVFDLPVKTQTFDTVINVFAPCAPAEYARVLKPGGHLIVAGAGKDHLLGLKEHLYDDPYLNDPRRDLPQGELTPVEVREVSFTITVEDRAHIEALFSMTPYYWRTSRDGHARLSHLETLTTPVSFDLYIYRKD